MELTAAKTAKQLLRERRPERFSDSVAQAAPRVDRSTLEYHLSTLTNRNQESDFQNFALKLAQLRICPNLRPQTGPTGGGDSKADAETYPVADDLALSWYVGNGRESASERWAFAFSTKEAWRGKVESDIAKIAKTNRGYTQAFFISSQFIPDKKRAEVEDVLRTEHRLERVTILDRGWILDEVFKGNHQELAIAELHIGVAPTMEVVVGPLDAQRQSDLTEADELIVRLLGEGETGPRLIACAIEAGRLACELERPRAEVEGRLKRAVDLADKYGSNLEKIEARYQYAWCVYFWLEDPKKLIELYQEIERLAKDSTNIVELRLLQTLWYVLYQIKIQDSIPQDQLRWNDHVLILSDALEKVTKMEGRPSAALEARAMLRFQQTAVTMPNVSPIVFGQFKGVFEQSKGFVGFPLKKTVDLISELGEALPDSEAFDELNEAMANIMAENEGEIAAAMQLLNRGWDKLGAGRDYDAIELAGRAALRLWKFETQKELIEALYVLSTGYERVGLLWASRGSLLNAASIMMHRWEQDHDPLELRLACFSRFKWIEMLLGRLPDTLAWFQLEGAIRSDQGVTSPEEQKSELMAYDGILGIHFLRADLGTLKKFERFPDVLGKLGLLQARVALLWALGWEEKAQKALSLPEGRDMESVLIEWRDNDAVDDLPLHWELGDQERLQFSSTILGCTVQVSAGNDMACRLVGESLLASLEAMLATAFREQLIPLFASIDVSILPSESENFPFSFTAKDLGLKLTCSLKCSTFDPNKLTRTEQETMKDKLTDVVVDLVGRSFPVAGHEERIKRMLFTNGGYIRAFNFTGSFVTLGNVLGDTPPTKFADWIFLEANEFSLKRTQPWDANISMPRRMAAIDDRNKEAEPGADIHHKKMAMLSVLNLRLWEKANWRGTMFYYYPEGNGAPTLALGFTDVEAAKEIFAGWIEQFGRTDAKNAIRVTIVRGISRKHPSSYRIVICGNPEGEAAKGKIYQGNIGRFQTMDTPDGINLRSFLENYGKAGKYHLAFAEMFDTGRPLDDALTLEKRDLIIREAWSIGVHDIDSIGIQEEDEPIIPANVQDAPVTELLAKRFPDREKK